MSQVVDHAEAAEIAVAVELAHLGQDVGQSGIAHLHQIEGAPDPRHVISESLVHPEWNRPANRRPWDDVERELVRELMCDQAVELVWRFVDGEEDAPPEWLGERPDAFRDSPGNDILLLELAVSLEDH